VHELRGQWPRHRLGRRRRRLIGKLNDEAKRRLHWSFEAPAAAIGSEEERLRVFRSVRNKIKEEVERALLQNNDRSRSYALYGRECVFSKTHIQPVASFPHPRLLGPGQSLLKNPILVQKEGATSGLLRASDIRPTPTII
jgi:hypothetical protein